MTGLESAIRNALERAGARDAATRARIYDAARSALEKGLAQRADLDPAVAQAQRDRFEALVRDVEAEEAEREAEAVEIGGIARDAEEPAGAAAPRLEGVRRETPAEVRAPEVSLAPASAPRKAAEAAAAPVAVAAEVKTERTRRGRKIAKRAEKQERRDRRRRRRGGLWSSLFLLLTLLVFGGLALWFVDATGLLQEAGSTNGGPNSFTKFDGGPGLATQGGFVGAWTPIYRPGKDADPAAGSAARVEIVKTERGQAARITSTSPGADGAVRFTVPVAAMQVLAKGKATIALDARDVEGKPTQISIECDFGSLGTCRRRRVDVANEMTDVVFNADVADGATLGGPGAIIINSDVGGRGRPVDIFAVGVQPQR